MPDDLKLQPQYPLATRIYLGGLIALMQGFTACSNWIKNRASEYPPDIIKTYGSRPGLPVRIFFPKGYYQPSGAGLPLLFTIHGGGFCTGTPADDDKWNRRFADSQGILVVALNYSKAPASRWPGALEDLEQLIHSVLNDDDSLPIRKDCVALAGFSSGGNLALALCQLPGIRREVRPSAVIPIYPLLNLAVPASEMLSSRRFKPELGPGLRGQTRDFMVWMDTIVRWAYVPAGTDLRTPLVSPYYAAAVQREDASATAAAMTTANAATAGQELVGDKEGNGDTTTTTHVLPRHIFLVAAELDLLAHPAWQMACRLAGRSVPTPGVDGDKVGQAGPAPEAGQLILNDERFAFTSDQIIADSTSSDSSSDGGSVRWLLIPDQVHGFDQIPAKWHGSDEAMHDAETKTEQYQRQVGEWLHQVVWRGLQTNPGSTAQ
ncbi:Alpha/Beta hydrolase protein [Xylariales sp. PMI_506]|nr:Alpha/Beta hydrolase protein [Xylariales sp. PMI_506]